MVMSIAQVFAVNTYSQSTRLSLNMKNVSAKTVLQQIEDKSQFYFIYDATVIDVDKKVSIESENELVTKILDELFKGSNVIYKINNRQIALTTTNESLSSVGQQIIKVSGKVTDSSGASLPGVSVVIKGTITGVITDASGNYSLSNILAGATLQFSFVGMKSQEIPVSGKTMINVVLDEDAIGIEEVVAIGYGTMKRRDITGSVASISGEQLAKTPVTNVAQALKGRLPGVNVVSADGRPDAKVYIRVRGGGSISQSNEPLIIVDGFPGSLNSVPANQIQSIDVLKDASSTAIYGARGANGVIIVTTKSGGDKLVVSYDGYMQFNKPTKYFPAMSAYDYIGYNWGYAKAINDGYAGAWEMLWGIGRYADTYNNAAGIDHYKNVDAINYAKQEYGESYSHNHSINISNGNKNSKFIISLNHVDDDGMKPNSWYKRTNASFKLDQNLGDRFKLSLNTSFVNIQKVVNPGSTRTASYFRPIATEDVLGEMDQAINTQLGFYVDLIEDMYNPVDRMKDYTPEETSRALKANTALSWDIIKGLTFKTELSLTANWNRDHTWSGAIANHMFDKQGNKTFGGHATIESGEGWKMRWVNLLNYDIAFRSDKHSLKFLAGQEVSDSHSENMSINGRFYPASFDAERAFAMMDQYLAAEPGQTPNYSYSASVGTPDRLQSYFGTMNYSLLDRYLLTATFRADGSSRFAPANRWGYFPAAALAWRLSEEGFLKDFNWIDNLKARISYGSVGNDAISANQWKMTWKSIGQTGYSINELLQVAYAPGGALPNPKLKWETTITRNLGIDYAFFNNKIYGTLEIYRNSTKDLLTATPVSPITGFSTTYENIGSTSNRGVELAIGGDIVRSKDFNLSTNFNININRGKIDELAEGVTGLYRSGFAAQPATGDYILEVGKPVGQVRGYTYDGWYSVEDFTYSDGRYTLKEGVPDIKTGLIGTVYGTASNKPGGQVAHPGVVKFKDISGPDGAPDGIVDEYDVSIIGDMNAAHTGGFNLSGNYRSFDFSFDFNWSYGNKIYNAEYLSAFAGEKENGLYRNRLDYLSTSYKIYDIRDGQLVRVVDPAELSALNANATTFLPFHENKVASTMGVQDGSYLRLNTVTLGYSIPKNLLIRIGIKKARLYGSVYNALTFTNYIGLDPEVNTSEGSGYPTKGMDFGTYPRARSFTFGVNVEF